jgi:hypothetical protein
MVSHQTAQPLEDFVGDAVPFPGHLGSANMWASPTRAKFEPCLVPERYE